MVEVLFMLRMLRTSLHAEEHAERASAPIPAMPKADRLLQRKWTADKAKKRFPKSVCTSLKDLCEL
jgi:hypothetical protein